MVTTQKVFCGNCIDILPKSGRMFDFIFADPPFNIGQEYEGYEDKMTAHDYFIFTTEWISACLAQLNPNGVLALHGPDLLCEMYLNFLSTQRDIQRIAWINWHYRFGQNKTSNWIDSRCHCLIYTRAGSRYTWNPEAVMVESDRVAYGDKRVADGKNGKRLPFTIWGLPSDGPYWGRVQGNSQERIPQRPNQLPEKYLERLIRAYTNPGDNILDPFGGTGTTAVVADALGRNCVSIDVSKAACQGILKRLVKKAVRIKHES